MRLVRKVRKNKAHRNVDLRHRVKNSNKSKKNKLNKERAPDPVEFVTFTFSVDELFSDNDTHLDVADDDPEMIMFVEEWFLNETSSVHPDDHDHVSVADALFSDMSLNDESPPTIVDDELDDDEESIINAFMACLDQWISSSGRSY